VLGFAETDRTMFDCVLGVVLLLIVPDTETIWIQKLSSLEETIGLIDYIGVLFSS
jgi:hypothetical protein